MENVFTIEDRIRDALKDEQGIRLLMIYGSAATGRMRVDSDVDIAVLCDQSLDASLKMELIGKLSAALNRAVDLVDLSTANGVILSEIMCKGKVVMKKGASDFAELSKRMIYNQSDMMPYYRRVLRERRERFVNE